LTITRSELIRTQNLIGAHWRDAAAARRFDVRDPADNSRITQVADSGRSMRATPPMRPTRRSRPGRRRRPASAPAC
jgi:acyl-CoA reductase-like NAD-dependent aldehyde dehydrogenase